LTLILLSPPCLLAQRLSESTGVNLFKNNCTKMSRDHAGGAPGNVLLASAPQF
jgi:hypothetical protein